MLFYIPTCIHIHPYTGKKGYIQIGKLPSAPLPWVRILLSDLDGLYNMLYKIMLCSQSGVLNSAPSSEIWQLVIPVILTFGRKRKDHYLSLYLITTC
jgi:hypothetical protein